MASVWYKPLAVLMFSWQANRVKAPQLPLYTASWVSAKVPPKLVEISTSAVAGTKLNQTELSMVLGDQQGGVDGSPALVAATFVYNIELQLPTVTASGIAAPQLSLAGCANKLVEKPMHSAKLKNTSCNFFIIPNP
jgi:hypothetical protein